MMLPTHAVIEIQDKPQAMLYDSTTKLRCYYGRCMVSKRSMSSSLCSVCPPTLGEVTDPGAIFSGIAQFFHVG